MKRNYNAVISRRKMEYPGSFDACNLNQSFVHAFESQDRVTVEFRTADGTVYETKRGRIGVTTGWKPCFILMLTTRSIGSMWCIGPNDRIKELA